MYVITGIGGNTGSAAAAALLAGGYRVRALVRDASRATAWQERGVELVEGDVTNPDNLARAFEGAAGAYTLAPADPHDPNPLDFYRVVADAVRRGAASAGLGRLVFLSSEAAHLSEGTGPILGAHHAEAILKGAAPHTTFLRPSFFQENWRSVFGLASEQGIMPSMLQPLDLARVQVATADIGKEVAALLTEPESPAIVELAGPAAYSANDAARAMAWALGREVAAVPVPREAWAETLTGAGLGQSYAALVCEMYDGINAGHVRFSGEGEMRHGQRTLEDTVKGWRG